MKSLTHNDPSLLFGRGEVIEEIVANCRAGRFTVVTSEPGVGVTSLLKYGVFPALQKAGAVAVSFSEWQGRSFTKDLREAVARAVREQADPSFYAESEELDSMFERIHKRTQRPVVMVLDRFEDYVRCHQNSPLSDSFDAELAHAVTTRKGFFVIGLQDHAISEFERLNQHIANLRGFEIRLKPLTVEEGRQTILADAASAGFEVEPAAVQAILAAPLVRTDEGGIHPFFLRTTAALLLDAERRRKSLWLTTANIEALGGPEQVLLESFDADIARLQSTHQELLFRWCNILISKDIHRLAVTEKGLTEYSGKLNRYVPELLTKLTELGMLRTVDTSGVVRYEIARDCYTPILRDWWERRESGIIAKRRAQFRVRSIWVAVSAIVGAYVIWLIFSK